MLSWRLNLGLVWEGDHRHLKQRKSTEGKNRRDTDRHEEIGPRNVGITDTIVALTIIYWGVTSDRLLNKGNIRDTHKTQNKLDGGTLQTKPMTTPTGQRGTGEFDVPAVDTRGKLHLQLTLKSTR